VGEGWIEVCDHRPDACHALGHRALGQGVLSQGVRGVGSSVACCDPGGLGELIDRRADQG
jgi:hypothetical protein